MKKILVMLVASVALSSCIKESTPGPQGPRGPQGVPGKDGSGTEITSYYFPVRPSQWKVAGTYDMAGYYSYAELSLGGLTQAVIDAGAVLVYFLQGINGQEYDNQLPYVLPFEDFGYFIRTIRYRLKPGTISFIVEDSDFRVPLPPFSNDVEFKVVIISKI